MDKDLIKAVSESLGENPTIVSHIIDHYEQFIADTIRSGRLENVRIPLFGIFRVNLKKLKYEVQVKPLPKSKVIRRKRDNL